MAPRLIFYHWIEAYDRSFRCDEGGRKRLLVDGEVVVEMREYTYGWERNSFREKFFNDCDAFILTFDVTMRQELDLILKSYATFLRYMDSKNTPKGCISPVGPFHMEPSEELSTFTCFPRLPLELQLAVLRAALTCPHPIVIPTPHVSGINLNILKVCKLFHEEGSKIFREENTFITMKPTTVVADTAWVTPNKPRAVTTEEGREFARNLGCKYVELSSKIHEPVLDVVSDLIREHRACTAAAEAVDRSDLAIQGQRTSPTP